MGGDTPFPGAAQRWLATVVVMLLATLGGLRAEEAAERRAGEAEARQGFMVIAESLVARDEVMGVARTVAPDGTATTILFVEDRRGAKGERYAMARYGIATEVVVTGPIMALGNGGTPNPRRAQERPVPIGVSLGSDGASCGTLGCRVRKGEDFFALSNAHVVAPRGCDRKASALQPGPDDGGRAPRDVIGKLADCEPIVFCEDRACDGVRNRFDAAIVATDRNRVRRTTFPHPEGYGTPRTRPVEARVGLPVMKYGRSTGLTRGVVRAVDGVFEVGYGHGLARFENQIVIGPPALADPGDSGSLLVAAEGDDERRPVGLVFAGSGEITLASPIVPVLDRFGVTVDGEEEPEASGQATSAAGLEAVKAIIAKHESWLRGIKGVTGVAASVCDGAPCIEVYVKKVSRTIKREVPRELDGYPVEIVVTRQFQALPEE